MNLYVSDFSLTDSTLVVLDPSVNFAVMLHNNVCVLLRLNKTDKTMDKNNVRLIKQWIRTDE